MRLLCGAHNRYRSDKSEMLRREAMAQTDKLRRECLLKLTAIAAQTNGTIAELSNIH